MMGWAGATRPTGDRQCSGSLVRLVALILALAACASASTTTANAASFSYDVPSIARVEVHEVGVVEASPVLSSGALEESVSPSPLARGASTTPSPRSVATNTGSSPNQMNKEIERRQAPKGIETSGPCRSEHSRSQDHVHITGERATLNRDGTWGHGGGELALTKKQQGGHAVSTEGPCPEIRDGWAGVTLVTGRGA
jgi:hypothetical protein